MVIKQYDNEHIVDVADEDQTCSKYEGFYEYTHTYIYMYMFNGFMLVIIKIISSSLALFCIVGYRYISDYIRWFPIWSHY